MRGRAGRRDQRGAALLTVLLLVAVIAVLAATALERLRVTTRLAGNAATLGQARAYAFAAETLAQTRLSALLSRSPDRISLEGGWSGRAIPLAVPGGSATAIVRDGGNCFNLNGLVVETPAGYSAFAPQIAQFARLIRLANVPAAADAVAAATADWIDSDAEALAAGAEDARYTGYRTAGTLMADPSELRAVAGVTPAAYAALRPWICTLPVATPAVLDVNTLTPEQAPLAAAALPDGVGVEAVRGAILRRPQFGYDSPAAFWNQAALAGTAADMGVQSQTAVTSRWFTLDIDIRIGTTTLHERALVDATTLPARIVSRQWGEAQ